MNPWTCFSIYYPLIDRILLASPSCNSALAQHCLRSICQYTQPPWTLPLPPLVTSDIPSAYEYGEHITDPNASLTTEGFVTEIIDQPTPRWWDRMDRISEEFAQVPLSPPLSFTPNQYHPNDRKVMPTQVEIEPFLFTQNVIPLLYIE
jgi:hypothetical protein